MPRKRGEGTSCHHCKKRTPVSQMVRCCNDGTINFTNANSNSSTTVSGRKRRRSCVKKYCLHCIKTFYQPSYAESHTKGEFICPSCKDECRCAACRRRTMKAKLNADGTKLKSMAKLEEESMPSILESKAGAEAQRIEEEQVNNLLEILETRPDVQDIIRKGMSLDFADENAKILYIAHLIDQALSRPDILNQYYKHATGTKGMEDDEDEDDDHPMTNHGNSNSTISMDLNSSSVIDGSESTMNDLSNSNAIPPPLPVVGFPTIPMDGVALTNGSTSSASSSTATSSIKTENWA